MDDPCRDILPLIKIPDQSEQKQSESIFIRIDGMNCGNCVNRVRNALLGTYGVTSVVIDQPQGLGEVRYNPSLTTSAVLIAAVAAAGNDGFHNYEAQIFS